ncbi:hypothetical protein E2562_009097 [Oryza meyeriana var. granulata]|uniref:Uncharacterized protein n=1 Tax=Oryza meyeriana var. granulata TaxID=110450 RepID=A0A6G1D1S6_9ORYZ|nr:hypothetical protein E2562_009097 [Oryza meyeriana var. granulata]
MSYGGVISGRKKISDQGCIGIRIMMKKRKNEGRINGGGSTLQFKTLRRSEGHISATGSNIKISEIEVLEDMEVENKNKNKGEDKLSSPEDIT